MSERNDADIALEVGLAAPNDLLAIYHAYDNLSAVMLAYRSDFNAAFAESPQGYGRQYLGAWETRNCA